MRIPAIIGLLAACACAQEQPKVSIEVAKPPVAQQPAPPQEGFSINLPVDEFILANGMKVLMVERRQAPRVYCGLYWKVGSVNERPGITGISHFFEHMMFKGTKKLGTTNWEKDAEYNAAIEAVMAEVRGLKLRGIDGLRHGATMSLEAAKAATNILKSDEPRWTELMAKFKELTDAQKAITISDHISNLFDSNGGTGSNASTTFDWTRYFVELPANKVELFFWTESETFMGPVWREFYPEREVVKEERRMRYESTPTGLIHQQFMSAYWQSMPYSWPVIGWASDIDQYTVAEAQRYYDTYYQPSNCTAVFVGDIDMAQIREMAVKYFGRMKNRDVKPEPIVTREPAQAAEMRMEAEIEAEPEVAIYWHGPTAMHADGPALDLFLMILSGRTGRLWRSLVDEKKIALSAGAGYWSLKYGGSLIMDAQPRDSKQAAEVEAAIYEILKDVQEKGVTERELQKVKNQSLAGQVRSFDSYMGIGDQLGRADVEGSWRDVFEYLERIDKVTAEDVKRVASQYFPETGRNVLVIKRQEKNQ